MRLQRVIAFEQQKRTGKVSAGRVPGKVGDDVDLCCAEDVIVGVCRLRDHIAD